MEKFQLIPGKSYRGRFWINEYGEFQCKPDGTAPEDSGRMKIVKQIGKVKIKESRFLGEVSVQFKKEETSWEEVKASINKLLELTALYFFPSSKRKAKATKR